jgi:hypothetical protein
VLRVSLSLLNILSRVLLTILSFGAVLEEFEVRDALANVLNMKAEIDMNY